MYIYVCVCVCVCTKEKKFLLCFELNSSTTNNSNGANRFL